MPREYIINGKEFELYTIGELADRLDRQRQTLRKWEREGIIPQAQYRSKTGRRLYSKEQIQAVVEIVDKYNLKQGQAIPKEFIEEVHAKFHEVSPQLVQ